MYSQEENTPAAGFENQIDEEIKAMRHNELMALQQEVSLALNKEIPHSSTLIGIRPNACTASV